MPVTALVIAVLATSGLPVVHVDRDDIEITRSCIVQTSGDPVADANGDGVLHVTGDDLTVRFAAGAHLRGATNEAAPDTLVGTGIRVTGRRVTLAGPRLSGFKVAIHATGADGLRVGAGHVSGNFRQRLRSTARGEAREDWLWPHENDANQWLDRYGAGLYVEDSRRVEIHDLTVRRGQNGIVFDRVTDSRVYDNDCSFLSGWGLALWRSSRNVVSRNAFDFCVRGYRHGVYNRGQDSAGILMFEQCSENVIAENSATHGGDGVFAFAGRDALGEAAPRPEASWYRERGNNGNLFVGNDLSDAAAHGLELTFSFRNQILGNRIHGNAICGLWGGYSQQTLVAGNAFTENGDAGYGLERGGVNIEHGADNRIVHNAFRRNACAVHLWWDEDEALLRSPWARANERGCVDNIVAANRAEGDAIFLHLRRTGGVTRVAGNELVDVGREIDADEDSPVDTTARTVPPPQMPPYPVLGTSVPVGARDDLAGREHIVMTPWGPYDWSEPRFVLDEEGVDDAGRPFVEFRLLGAEAFRVAAHPWTDGRGWRATHSPRVRSVMRFGTETPGVLGTLRLTAETPGVETVVIEFRRPGAPPQIERRLVVSSPWAVRHFVSPVDPREDPDAWRAAAESVEPAARARLDERYGSDGPRAGMPADHFGTIATTDLPLPAGHWRLRTISDDGIRVWLDDALVIDDWTWHPPREHTHEWSQSTSRQVRLRVEHFELDGHAVLAVELERGSGAAGGGE